MNFDAWFRTWVARHPLKTLRRDDPAQYTAEVMERIRTIPQPAPASAVPWHWPAWTPTGLSVATAVVVLFLILGVFKPSTVQLADHIIKESDVLAKFDETTIGEPVVEDDAEELAQELQHRDTLLLAEATPSDDQWINDNLNLLEQLNQEDPADETGPSSTDSDWLEELKQLDESELSSPT